MRMSLTVSKAPSKTSRKLEKHAFSKHQVPKDLSETKNRNTYESSNEADSGIITESPPYRSVLDRVRENKTSMKRSYLPIVNQKMKSTRSKAPSKTSRKLEKNSFSKRQVAKCLPETKIRSANEESNEPDFNIVTEFPPYKSILKRVSENKTSIKHSYSPNVNEKDIIKARYQTNAFRQNKVKFKSMSCQNLEFLSCENIPSDISKEESKLCEEKQTSLLTDTNISEEISCGPDSKDSNREVIKDHMLPLNKHFNTNEKSLENQKGKRNILLFDQTQSANEHQNYFQIDRQKSETSGDKSPILGLFSPNLVNTADVISKIRGENLNKRYANDAKLLDTKVNKIELKIENFRIFNEGKTPEASERKAFEKNTHDENLEFQCLECGDQGNKFNVGEEDDFIIAEKESNPSDPEDSNKNLMPGPLSSENSPDLNQVAQERMRRKAVLRNEVDDKINLLTMKFLQEINKSKDIKKKTPSTKYGEISYAEEAFENESEFPVKSKVKQKNVLLSTAKQSNAEKCNMPQKILPFHKTPKLDLNKSGFRSPSKIPRLNYQQFRDRHFSPSSIAGLAPIETKNFQDEITQKRRTINYLHPEDRDKEREDLNRSMLTPDSSVLSEGHGTVNILVENTVLPSPPASPICHQEEDITFLGKAQVAFQNECEFAIKPKEEQKNVSFYNIESSEAEENNTPQKILPLQKMPKLDLNNSVSIENDISGVPHSPSCHKEEDITLIENEVFPETYEDFMSCISDDERDLLYNSIVCKREINNVSGNGDDTEILSETSTSPSKLRRTPEFIRKMEEQINSKRFSSCKTHDKKKGSVKNIKKSILKGKKKRINAILAITCFFMCFLLFILFIKISDIQLSDN